MEECANCAGYWLDAGELALIRAEHQAEIERPRAVERHLEDVARGKLGKWRAGNAEQLKRARTIDPLLRFSRTVRYECQGRT